KTKNLVFYVTLSGSGVLNFDGKDEGKKTRELLGIKVENNNNTFSKVDVYKTDNGYSAIPKISSNANKRFLRETRHVTNLVNDKDGVFLPDVYSSFEYLLFGNMFPALDSTKRKGAVTFTDAKEISGATLTQEFCCTNLTPFIQENLGKTTWEYKVIVDIDQLIQICLTPEIEQSIYPDHVLKFIDKMKEKYGELVEKALYKTEGELFPAERIMLSEKHCKKAIMYIVKKIATTILTRKNAYANCVSIKYQAMNHGEVTFLDKTKAVEIYGESTDFNENFLDNISFYNPYTKLTDNETEAFLQGKSELTKNKDDAEAIKKEEKEQAKKAIKAKKEAKEKATQEG
ncbi:MAG: hypothetical protein ACKOWO_05470, partial [Sediminibacterium sp.]